jgi:AcrR family transcriptional regulator
MGKGSETRERILEIAEASVLAKGLGATSIDEIIAEAGLTKSGFFYHFPDKAELARSMLNRYVEANDKLFDEIFARADELADGDPLQSFLIGLKLLAEVLADLPHGHPGCLIAAMCYQERLYDRDVREIMSRSVRGWNAFFRTRIEAIMAAYPANEPVDAEQLSRMFSCVVDGGIIMSKALTDPAILPQQVLMMRNYIKLLFSPAVPARAAA